MRKYLLIPLVVLLVAVALTQPVFACGIHFFKAITGSRSVPIKTFQTWEFQFWIQVTEPMPGEATTIENIVVKDKLPAELEFGEMWFTDGEGNEVPSIGTVTIENMGNWGKGNCWSLRRWWRWRSWWGRYRWGACGSGCMACRGKGFWRSASELTWTIDQLDLGTYVLHIYVHTKSNGCGKFVGFTTPGNYTLNPGATMTYFYMDTMYTLGPTPAEYVIAY